MEGEVKRKTRSENLDENYEDIQNAIGYLKTAVDENREDDANLWDFLCTLVNKLLSERPKNAYDAMENIVLSIKKEKDMGKEGASHSVLNLASKLEYAEILQDLLKTDSKDEEWMLKSSPVSPWSEVTEQMQLFNKIAGIIMPETFVLQLSLSIRRLLQNNPDVIRARFWGRMSEFYLVVEAEMSEAGYTRRREEQEAKLEEQRQLEAALEEKRKTEESYVEITPESKTSSNESLPVPAEPPGTGVNRMVYFVSSRPAGPGSWQILPDVTPQQISAARKIKALFSGDLSAPMKCWPQFPGDEMTLLRAQIARISAATHVAPAGFFKMRRKRSPSEELEEESEESEEEDEEEGEDMEREVVVNTRYQPPPPSSLLQLAGWLHYTPHILQQQARTRWWNPNPQGDEDEEDEIDSEVDDDRGPRAEVGPRPFSTLSEDRASPELVPGISACFALRSASCRVPAVVARSLIWPGAFTLVVGRRLEHVYLGWGVKSSSLHHAPSPPPTPAVEPSDLVFMSDPSPVEEAEAERRAAPDQDDEGDEEEEGSDE